MPVPKKLRFEVLKRDSFKCRYCGRTEADGVKLHIDHVIPISLGGRNDHENLATACADCNLGKSANMLNDPRIIGIDFEAQKRIFDTAKESLDRYREYVKAKDEWEHELVSELLTPFRRVFQHIPWWDLEDSEVFWSFGQLDDIAFAQLPDGLRASLNSHQVFTAVYDAEARVRRAVIDFFKKLGPDRITEAAEIAALKFHASHGDTTTDEAFKYFCGICHRMMRGE